MTTTDVKRTRTFAGSSKGGKPKRRQTVKRSTFEALAAPRYIAERVPTTEAISETEREEPVSIMQMIARAGGFVKH